MKSQKVCHAMWESKHRAGGNSVIFLGKRVRQMLEITVIQRFYEFQSQTEI